MSRRITPACAGKTTFNNENEAINEGSPPRVREKRHGVGSVFRKGGITPACAGKTFFVALENGKYRDHPRVCGKNVQTNRPKKV